MDPKEGRPSVSPSERRTLVDEGTHLKGALSSTCAVRVQGSVEGDVTSPGLSVSATGSVTGTVKTGALKSVGRLSGEIEAETAQVAGTVADKTILRAASMDLRLTAPSGKVSLTFTKRPRDDG